MQITFRYFAALRESLGRDRETVSLPEGATITEARVWLSTTHPAIAPILSRCLASRNRDFATDTTLLMEGDEVVFIPPMAGGSATLLPQ